MGAVQSESDEPGPSPQKASTESHGNSKVNGSRAGLWSESNLRVGSYSATYQLIGIGNFNKPRLQYSYLQNGNWCKN